MEAIDSVSAKVQSGVKLGLAVGQRFAKALGGSISAKSESDTGSGFTLLIQTRAVELPILIPDGQTVTRPIESEGEALTQFEEITAQLEESKVVSASYEAALQESEALTESQRIALLEAESRVQSEIQTRQAAEAESADRASALSEANEAAAARRENVEESQNRIEKLSVELAVLQSVADSEA